MKVFLSEQIKAWDHYTIEKTSVTSIDLMERAAKEFIQQLLHLYQGNDFIIFCGSGNNGGDGLAIARLLHQHGYPTEVWLFKDKKLSADAQVNYDRLVECNADVKVFTITSPVHESEWLRINAKPLVVIDALLGTGLNRNVNGFYAECIHRINALQKKVVAVDIPSGLFADCTTRDEQIVMKATDTISFQIPKRSFFYENSFPYVGNWYVVDISLDKTFNERTHSAVHYIDWNDIKEIYKPRTPFAHKGNFGRGLLVAGSYGMMGAAVMAAKASLRAGIGLLKIYSPSCGLQVLQTTVPEAIVLSNPDERSFSNIPDLTNYHAIAIGPGWEESDQSLDFLKELLTVVNQPLIIDAGAINLIGRKPELLELLPQGSILTPHRKEFDRLAGKTLPQEKQENQAIAWAREYQIQFILKGRHSAVVLSDGTVHYNSTGNPGMAKAGSGDCLTGILMALLAQGYSPQHTAIMGTFLHGYAGDQAAILHSQEAMLPTDLIENISDFFKAVHF